MTINEIKVAIIKLLRAGTDIENITGEDVKQTKFPLLHVQLIPLTSSLFHNSHSSRLMSKRLLVDISYMEEERTANTELYRMLEVIDGMFQPHFAAGDRILKVESTSMNITDDIGHYTFYLNYTDGIEIPVPEPVAEQINISFKINKQEV